MMMNIEDFTMIKEHNSAGSELAVVECTNQKNLSTMGRNEIIKFLDNIDTQVEALRKDALKLQEQQDHLLTCFDLMKNTDVLSAMSDAEQDEVKLQIKRIDERLQTVDIKVKTIRNGSQVDSLNVINHFIDDIIRFGDRIKCQKYLDACNSSNFYYSMSFEPGTTFGDKKFEGHFIGCTLDDQKRIEKRLQALLSHIMAQKLISISD